MTVSAGDVAAVLRARLPGLPTKKLHKLLYYCQGHHLAAFGEPLFSDTISAWDMGPVVGALWYTERRPPAVDPAPPVPLDEAQLNTIGYVLHRYGALTGQDLENLTHSEAPWRLADRGRAPHDSARIEPGWIRDYFQAEGAAGDGEPRPAPAAVDRWLGGAGTRRARTLRPDPLEEIMARLARA